MSFVCYWKMVFAKLPTRCQMLGDFRFKVGSGIVRVRQRRQWNRMRTAFARIFRGTFRERNLGYIRWLHARLLGAVAPARCRLRSRSTYRLQLQQQLLGRSSGARGRDRPNPSAVLRAPSCFTTLRDAGSRIGERSAHPICSTAAHRVADGLGADPRAYSSSQELQRPPHADRAFHALCQGPLSSHAASAIARPSRTQGLRHLSFQEAKTAAPGI